MKTSAPEAAGVSISLLVTMRIMLTCLFFLATIVATCHGQDLDHGATYQIHPLRLKSGSGGQYIPGVFCTSWRLAVEAHNVIDWSTVPEECEGYMGNYMLGGQYREDFKLVTHEAFVYASSLNLSADGKDIWVFDVDDTVISHLPYFSQHGFGTEPYNYTTYTEWVEQADAPALPESLKLYNGLLNLGFNVVFLTGRSEDQRNITVINLEKAGYQNWLKLILKDSSYSGKTAVAYKSAERKKLEEEGYKIIGNIGDQWSDLLGTNTGNRTFKIPDPVYYLS